MKGIISAEEKLNAVKEYLDGQSTQGEIASRLGITNESFRTWIMKYKAMGNDAFYKKGYKSYSKELKEQAVSSYLAGEGSLMAICQKYKIHATSPLMRWIKKYNSHEELKASRTGGSFIMTRGRKTTFKERIEIASYCISHNYNYAEVAEKFSISYHQARNYTIKYESGGIDALHDNRGKRKPEDSLTEIEKLRAELKLERAKRQNAEMEVSFLKKLNEIERRRG